MRYETTIEYNNKVVIIKIPNKQFAKTFQLPDFLKSIREMRNHSITQVHLLTDFPKEECEAFENGTMPIPQLYLELFAIAYKLPKKIKQLGYIQEQETKKIIIAKLKELRATKGYPQSIVAFDLGIARSTYACYESGKNEPDIHTLIKIADYYNVSLDYLVGREPQNNL